jgi:hypothetical protein
LGFNNGESRNSKAHLYRPSTVKATDSPWTPIERHERTAMPRPCGSLFAGGYRSGRKQAVASREREANVARLTPLAKTSLAHSELWATFHCTGAQIHAHVYTDIGIEADETVLTAFSELNQRRRNRSLIEHFNATRFRVVQPVELTSGETEIELALAPIDFACVALMKDPETSSDVKRYVKDMITKKEERLPRHLRPKEPSFGVPNYDLLGTQISLITADGKTLFRQRGSSVLFAKGRWDVSVSGFSGQIDFIAGTDLLDPGLTVQHETLREIGVLRCDPRQIHFTGLHRNTHTGAIDLLAYWQIETRSKELAGHIGIGEEKTVFTTTRRAVESYVWDTRNLIVTFEANPIVEAFAACGIGVADFEPQSLLCVELALRAFNGQTLGIEIERLGYPTAAPKQESTAKISAAPAKGAA